MNYFRHNLKFLRKSKRLTQETLAQKIGVNRPIIGSYEEGRAEPKLETLQNISHYFKVTLDDLLETKMDQETKMPEKDIVNNHLRVLPILINEDGKERVSVVPVKAAAGYLNGYADPQFVENLPSFDLPLQEASQGTYRLFQINGDSMLPIPNGSYILTEYLENWNWIKDNECYIVVSKDDGIVYKRLQNELNESRRLTLHSDNKDYDSYTINEDQIIEVWKAKGYLTFDLPKDIRDQSSIDELSTMMLQLKNEVEQLKKK